MARSSSKNSKRPQAADADQRLQKVLAAAGVGSRRECEELILEGRVEVDRQVVTELGVRADPTRQEIRVDGVALPRPKRIYYAVNKPAGVVSTSRDPAGRPRVIDLVPTDHRLFAVGRLDRSSEGLIIVTNDGELTNRLSHPRYGVEKTYQVRIAGIPSVEAMQKLRKGVHLAEGPARVSHVRLRRKHKQSSDLEIVLNEGRNREIRRILARIGHKVLKLRRVAIGPLKLGDLPPGGFRRLTAPEVDQLRRSARRPSKPAKAAAPDKRSADRQPAELEPGQGSAGAVLEYDQPQPKKQAGRKSSPAKGPKKGARRKPSAAKRPSKGPKKPVAQGRRPSKGRPGKKGR